MAPLSQIPTCPNGPDGPASSTGTWPQAVTVNAAGDVFFVEYNDCRVREISGGNVATVAGDGLCQSGVPSGVPATSVALSGPRGLAVDRTGTLYIADGYSVYSVVASTIHHIAGNNATGLGGGCSSSSDDAPLNTALGNPSGLAVDGNDNLYIAEGTGCRVRKLAAGVLITVAGNGSCGFAGDGSDAMSASLSINPLVSPSTQSDRSISRTEGTVASAK